MVHKSELSTLSSRCLCQNIVAGRNNEDKAGASLSFDDQASSSFLDTTSFESSGDHQNCNH
uniref:Uncharacterized protein n=1 Tax=Salix viminalis TaxID=40686 RepID=A0A6N2KL51_SALVM